MTKPFAKCLWGRPVYLCIRSSECKADKNVGVLAVADLAGSTSHAGLHEQGRALFFGWVKCCHVQQQAAQQRGGTKHRDHRGQGGPGLFGQCRRPIGLRDRVGGFAAHRSHKEGL